jgi:deazaflavin-dependent oxidoreductase (nitroreductase family)
LTERDASDGSRSPARSAAAGAGAARGTDRTPALDDDLASDVRFARLRTRGRRSGVERSVTVGFVDDGSGAILVAAGTPDSDWAFNLLADPAVEVAIGDRVFTGTAEFIEEGDPRRGRAIRDLILRYGTPSEGLGSGPIFLIRPREPS